MRHALVVLLLLTSCGSSAPECPSGYARFRTFCVQCNRPDCSALDAGED